MNKTLDRPAHLLKGNVDDGQGDQEGWWWLLGGRLLTLFTVFDNFYFPWRPSQTSGTDPIVLPACCQPRNGLLIGGHLSASLQCPPWTRKPPGGHMTRPLTVTIKKAPLHFEVGSRERGSHGGFSWLHPLMKLAGGPGGLWRLRISWCSSRLRPPQECDRFAVLPEAWHRLWSSQASLTCNCLTLASSSCWVKGTPSGCSWSWLPSAHILYQVAQTPVWGKQGQRHRGGHSSAWVGDVVVFVCHAKCIGHAWPHIYLLSVNTEFKKKFLSLVFAVPILL